MISPTCGVRIKAVGINARAGEAPHTFCASVLELIFLQAQSRHNMVHYGRRYVHPPRSRRHTDIKSGTLRPHAHTTGKGVTRETRAHDEVPRQRASHCAMPKQGAMSEARPGAPTSRCQQGCSQQHRYSIVSDGHRVLSSERVGRQRRVGAGPVQEPRRMLNCTRGEAG